MLIPTPTKAKITDSNSKTIQKATPEININYCIILNIMIPFQYF